MHRGDLLRAARGGERRWCVCVCACACACVVQEGFVPIGNRNGVERGAYLYAHGGDPHVPVERLVDDPNGGTEVARVPVADGVFRGAEDVVGLPEIRRLLLDPAAPAATRRHGLTVERLEKGAELGRGGR